MSATPSSIPSPSPSPAFPERLLAAVREKKTPILLGIDPREDQIPEDCFPAGPRTTARTAEGFLVFGERLLKALAPHIAAVKPQIAFYERLGPAGLAAYAGTLRIARELGILSIGDVKRGDIGSTAEAYAEAHLGGPGEGPFEADAVTLSPWLGKDSIDPYLARCRERGKGVYLLLHTSNPGSTDLQEAPSGDGPLYARLAGLIEGWQRDFEPYTAWSPIGVVVGATWPRQLTELLERLPRAPFLVPGYGAQGGTGKDVAALYAKGWAPHLVNASRSLTYAWQKKKCSLEEGALAAAAAMKADIPCPA